MESEFESESVRILGGHDRDDGPEEAPNRAPKAKRNGNAYIELPVISFENQLYGVIGDDSGAREGAGDGPPVLHLAPPKPSSCRDSDDRPLPWQRALQIGLPALVAVTVVIALTVHYGAGRKPIDIATDQSGDHASIWQPSNAHAPTEYILVTRTIQGEARVTQGRFSDFQPQYENLRSDEATALTSSFLSQVDSIFQQSNIAAIYQKGSVLNIRSGSVVVQFQLNFAEDIVLNDTSASQPPPGGQKYKPTDTETTFNEVISTVTLAITDGTDKESYHMGEFVVEKESLQFTALNKEIRPIVSSTIPPTASTGNPQSTLSSSASSPRCPGNQFFCQSGVPNSPGTNCIFVTGVCNGLKDCVLGEDELDCGTKCYNGGFRCRGKEAKDWKTGSTCTKPRAHCDNLRDCTDGSDEEGCPPCSREQFTCLSGHIVCVPLKARCDLEFNCEDKSDEKNCTFTCTPNQFRCKNFDEFTHENTSKPGRHCIEHASVCDRVEHCSDNSDEDNCTYMCHKGKFMCKTGLISRWPRTGYCLEESERCNGFTECEDGSDEADCGTVVAQCTDQEIHCKNGTDVGDGDACIKKSYRCDRVQDCTDFSDEADCSYSCPSDEDVFQCLSGTISEAPYRGFCVPGHSRCDGKPNCADSSDEAQCEAPSCTPGHFQCEDGFHITSENKCIPSNYVCDRESDCSDNSDERNCNYTCPEGKVACKTGIISRWPFNGYCLRQHEICDGHIDCRDQSDEDSCRPVSCAPGEFQCVAGMDELGNYCISTEYQCNKVFDCSDSSDEDGCEYSCPVGQLACNNSTVKAGDGGYCYDVSERCDGAVTCKDASDEEECDAMCSTSQFRCLDGIHNATGNRCIGDHYRCDRVVDCTDGSDEEDCDSAQCPLGLTPCTTGVISAAPHRGFCIAEHKKCNNVSDCLDKSDESSCSAVCSSSEFLCRNGSSKISGGRCIINSFRCDRDLDCLDGSDEENCHYECPEDKFACKSGKLARFPYYGFCISRRDVCDGYKDCADNSDELNCNSTCPRGSFVCKNSSENSTVCKPLSYKCDRVRDCPDGSDEANCTYACDPGKFMCARGTSSRYFNIFGRHFVYTTRTFCIYEHDVCDGTTHCQDGSDEQGCEIRCKEDEFLCTNSTSILTKSRCIPAKWRCDRDRDCRDGSDEQGCEYHCPPHQRPCLSGSMRRWPYTGFCYWQWERCDGSTECSDGSDERNCGTEP